eukprot:scaffold4353_cov217-Pinguiococcus_pyrenoidosus.AAC.2
MGALVDALLQPSNWHALQTPQTRPTLAYRSGPPTLSWNLMLSPDSLMPSSSMLVCSFSKVSSGSTAVGSTAGLLSNCLHRYEKSDFPWYAARTWTKGETNHARGRGAGDKAHMVDSKSLRSGMVFDFGPSKIFLLDASSFVRTENLLSDLPNCPAVDAAPVGCAGSVILDAEPVEQLLQDGDVVQGGYPRVVHALPVQDAESLRAGRGPRRRLAEGEATMGKVVLGHAEAFVVTGPAERLSDQEGVRWLSAHSRGVPDTLRLRHRPVLVVQKGWRGPHVRQDVLPDAVDPRSGPEPEDEGASARRVVSEHQLRQLLGARPEHGVVAVLILHIQNLVFLFVDFLLLHRGVATCGSQVELLALHEFKRGPLDPDGLSLDLQRVPAARHVRVAAVEHDFPSRH